MKLGTVPVQTRETPRESRPKPQPSRGSQSRSLSGRGPNFNRASPLAEASGCAIRGPLSPFPRRLQTLRPASRQSARRSRRIPARSADRPSPPVSLRFRVEPSFRFPVSPVRPSGRFPDLPANHPDGLPSFWPAGGFPLRRDRKSRPSRYLPQARNLIVFRELGSLFAIRPFRQ